ncbi:MAG: hypothetical protein CMM08_20485 [Rhodospirillaceae bacterium]|nr:hypothetical protein [Rhodospirillaceae bacterium]
MTAANPFAAHAETYTPRPVRTRQRRCTVRGSEAARQKRIDERNLLSARYRREEARRVAEALSSPLGRRLADLLASFDRLTIEDAEVMIDTIALQGWLLAADRELRHLALRLIDRRIARIRRVAGLPELDDPLPGAPDTAFLVIKRLLRVS